MSRFHGPQQPGAARELRDLRRAEAEQRQAEERERDRQRAERHANEPERPLTDDELAGLYRAVALIGVEDLLVRLGVGR